MKQEMGSREAALRNGIDLLAADPGAALVQAQEMLRIDGRDPDALHLASKALAKLGRTTDSEAAERQALANWAQTPTLARAAQALQKGRDQDAESAIRERLAERADDAVALTMLANIAAKAGQFEDAEKLLRQAIEISPTFMPAREELPQMLAEQARFPEALEAVEALLANDPANRRWRQRKIAMLGKIGRYDEALAASDALLVDCPGDAAALMVKAHHLKTLGRSEECLATYRMAIESDPTLGEAWWSIANTKVAEFDEADITKMERELTKPLNKRSQTNFLFALGSAYEKAGRREEAFSAYAKGNGIWRQVIGYDPGWITRQVDEVLDSTSADWVERLTGDSPSARPIFIVGMPRAGSTLIEQILASHSAIEGTAELPYIPVIARNLRNLTPGMPIGDALSTIGNDERERLGRDYLNFAETHRTQKKPLFTDKTPNNWLFIPLILTILPNARIIDARRDAMACCFSNFKQHFAQGQAFTYSLEDVGQYYRDYVRLIDHARPIARDRIMTVRYENLVADTEREVRTVLSFLSLDFEPQCLEFHKSDRAVRTASAEQVRQPISLKGNEAWRPFERWLGPLRDALGPLGQERAS